eukprot:g5165.t1
MDGEEHAAMAKIAADSAVDTVFSSMMTKLDTQIASLAPGGPGSPGLGDEDGGAYSPDAQREDFVADPAVREPLFARVEAAEAAEQAAEQASRKESKNKAERYSRTTALLRRAQLLEEQLKQKAAAGRPDNMEGSFGQMGRIDDAGGYRGLAGDAQSRGGDGENAGQPRDGGGYNKNIDNAFDPFGDRQATKLTRRGGKHLGLSGTAAELDVDPEEAARIEETIRHAERAKRNVRRYKREAEQRRKRRLMIEAAEADALKAQIRATEERRRRAAESAEETKARKLRERLDKSRRERAERKRRREELFAAEKRMKQLKHKPMHVRMAEDYKRRVELPELERRKKQLAEIHRRFTENSPDTSELEMRARAHQALQRLSGERDHHRLKGRERTWMETRVWYHGNAKHRVLKEDRERRTALQRKNEMLRMKMERKKAYDKWVKRVAPPQLDSNKVGEMQERVQRLRDPAPRKTQRDRARARRPRRKKDREGFDAGESPAPEPYIRQPEPGTSVSDRGGYMPRFGGKSSSSEPDDFVTEELQHQKLQNMYLESISKQMERLADEAVVVGAGEAVQG